MDISHKNFCSCEKFCNQIRKTSTNLIHPMPDRNEERCKWRWALLAWWGNRSQLSLKSNCSLESWLMNIWLEKGHWKLKLDNQRIIASSTALWRIIAVFYRHLATLIQFFEVKFLFFIILLFQTIRRGNEINFTDCLQSSCKGLKLLIIRLETWK